MRKNKLLSGCCIVLIFSLVSCNKQFGNADELNAFVQNEKNEYKASKTVNGIDFALQYKPTDMMVQQEIGDSISPEKVDQLRNKYKDNLYFSLSMSGNDTELLSVVIKDRQRYNAMVNQLVFGMDRKIFLISPEKDTLKMLDYVYPRMYGMSKSTNLLLVFPRDPKFLDKQYLNFTILDFGMETGDVKFKLDPNVIKKEPTLNF